MNELATQQVTSGVPHDVAAFYCFTPLKDLPAIRENLLEVARAHDLCGTTLLAPEGFNGTMAAPREPGGGLDAYLAVLKPLAGNHAIELKHSSASERPFKRLKVRLKKEIVTMGVPAIDPNLTVGTYVEPKDWNRLIAGDDVVVVDTRNLYETSIGTFDGAIDPKTRSFREFPQWAEANRTLFEGKRVAMFCTGGIRCEKSTAFMKQIGHENVFHLKGGILKYLEEVPASESRFSGSCFVFDERVALEHGLVEAVKQTCPDCGGPVIAPLDPDETEICPDCAREPYRAARSPR